MNKKIQYFSLILLIFTINYPGYSNIEIKDPTPLELSVTAKAFQSKNIDSAFYYANKGLKLAQTNNDSLGLASNYAVLGDLFVVKNELDKAKAYYSKANEYYKNKNLFEYAQTSMKKANILSAQGKYFEGLQLYQEGLRLSLRNNFKKIIPHLYNNMGVIYFQIDDYEHAFPYFEKAHHFFLEENDEYNVAISLSNLGQILAFQHKDEQALEKFNEIISYFLKNKKWIEVSSTYNMIADVYLEQKKYSSAEKYLMKALNIIENYKGIYKGPSSIHTTKIYSNIAKLYFHKKDYPQALKYAKLALDQSLLNSYNEDSAMNSKLISEVYEKQNQPEAALTYYKLYLKYWESLKKEETIKKVLQLKMQAEQDLLIKKNQLDNIKKEAESKQRAFLNKTLVVIILLTVIIFILLYRDQKTKTLKALLNKEKLEIEKEKLNQELTYKDKELTTNMIYLVEKNEFITSLAKKMYEIKETFSKSNQEVVQQIINELRQNTSKKTWEEFEMRFIDVHADFYNALQESFPDLTPNELKLCAFLRLNMTTKEISAITHQSVKSIDMARFRLRKKMNIDRDINLIAFLTQM